MDRLKEGWRSSGKRREAKFDVPRGRYSRDPIILIIEVFMRGGYVYYSEDIIVTKRSKGSKTTGWCVDAGEWAAMTGRVGECEVRRGECEEGKRNGWGRVGWSS